MKHDNNGGAILASENNNLTWSKNWTQDHCRKDK